MATQADSAKALGTSLEPTQFVWGMADNTSPVHTLPYTPEDGEAVKALCGLERSDWEVKRIGTRHCGDCRQVARKIRFPRGRSYEV